MPASRSLIALIVGTIVLFALVFVELKPGASGSGGGSSSSQGLGAYQSDINKAKQAVGTSNASNAASGNENAGSSAASSAGSSSTGASATGGSKSEASGSTTASSHSSAKPATKAAAVKHTSHPASAAQNLGTVKAALSAHKAVAMLFYNPSAADDQAVKQELGSVPTHGGHVVKLAIPLSQVAKFTAVTQQVPVNFSPTLVLIAPSGQASEIVGYSDAFEIDQRVADALATS